MDDLALLADLHLGGARQGPGGPDETRRAIELSKLAQGKNLKIADIGCGTGASTLILAQTLDADIIAVDFLTDFLDRLDATARDAGLRGRIRPLAASMDALSFEDQSLDAIWSEGAIYNIGFETGVRGWRRLLKPGGVLAVSDLTWLTGDRPAELERRWTEQYADVATAAEKMAVLEANGYFPIGYFPLPDHCWLDNYYRPLQARFGDFLARNDGAAAARAIVDAEQDEIALYERYGAFFSYGFYVARKVDP